MTDDDDLDARILAALVRDGRASVREIADTTGEPATAVQKRVRSLERDGVIRGYRPDLDYEALGYELTVVFRLVVERNGFPDFLERLREDPQLLEVYEVTGRVDVIAIGKYVDAEGMNDGINRVLSDRIVRTADTSIVNDVVLERGSIPGAADDLPPDQND